MAFKHGWLKLRGLLHWEQKQCLPMVCYFCPQGARRNLPVGKRFQSTSSSTTVTAGSRKAKSEENVKIGRKLGTQKKAWNEAATLMIVAPMNNSEPYYLGYLLVERSRTGGVMPGNWVFPGGNVDPSDSDIKWIDLFKKIHNIDISQRRILRETAHVPEIYHDEGLISKEITLRITAIREAFEEAGILCCRPRKLDPSKHLHNGMLHYEFAELEDKKQLQAWQKRVRKNGQDFIELCKELDCAPDIHSLRDWNNWLTPAVFKPKSRFDTMFYIIILPKLARIVIDGNEATSAQWISPERAISDHAKGEVRLMPPQIYELSRMRNLKTIKDLQHRVKLRNELGIERYFPVIKNVNDGTLFLLPGDDLYPDPPNFLKMDSHSLEEFPKTIAELKESSVNLHRGIANSDGVITEFEINIERYGHVY